MKLRDIMSGEPLTVGQDVSPDAARELMTEGKMHHLPIVENGQLVGMWVATEGGPMVVMGPDRIAQFAPDSDALTAVDAVLGEAAVVATDDGEAVGILTRTDALDIVRAGLAAMQPTAVRPLVVRLVGPRNSGKTTILLRTITRLTRCKVGLVETNPHPPDERLPHRVQGTTIAYAPHAHWRKGFVEAIERMGGLDIVFVEDRDRPPTADIGLGEDVEVVVVAADDVGNVNVPTLADAQAVLITKAEQLAGFDITAERVRLRQGNPNLAVFVIGLDEGDHGQRTWLQWLEARLRQHRH